MMAAPPVCSDGSGSGGCSFPPWCFLMCQFLTMTDVRTLAVLAVTSFGYVSAISRVKIRSKPRLGEARADNEAG